MTYEQPLVEVVDSAARTVQSVSSLKNQTACKDAGQAGSTQGAYAIDE
jgi:hypothetical protein